MESDDPDVMTPIREPLTAGGQGWAHRVAGIPARVVRLIHDNAWLSFLITVSTALGLAIVITIVLPGYTWPSSRLYTSKFGYASLTRKLKRPFAVPATRLETRTLRQKALGEGLVRSEPLVVPIVPMGSITKVHVSLGDRVTEGQLIAEVDPTRATIKVEAARAAVQTAKAELERVKIGSAYILTYERPRLDQIRAESMKKQAELQRQLIGMNTPLLKKGYATKAELLTLQLDLAKTELAMEESKFNLTMSTEGVKESITIAESALKEAELSLQHRLAELKDYKVHSIADGLVERVLVHEGEYNQDPGKPGFLLATESWFEGNFDQGSFPRIRAGDAATVRLEAYPERGLAGRVTWVSPFVNYDLGGPESTRPIRPMGTGAPEWPATFPVRIRVDSPPVPVIPGMTGFCLIENASQVTCLPRAAVSAVTSGKGIVYVIRGERFEPREVTLGLIDGDWVQIQGGLERSEEVILDGYQVLEPTDRIKVVASPEEPR